VPCFTTTAGNDPTPRAAKPLRPPEALWVGAQGKPTADDVATGVATRDSGGVAMILASQS
jgi:hypothetical protein